MLGPLLVIAAQCDIEGDNIFDLAPVDRAIADRGASSGEAMEERFVAFGLVASKEIAASGRKDRLQILRGFLDTIVVHLQDEVVLEALTVVHHPFRQVPGKQRTHGLHDLVAEVAWQERQAFADGVESSLDREHQRQPAGAEIVDRKKRVLAIFLRNVERDAVQILARNRQRTESRQYVPAYRLKFRRIVGADVKYAGPRGLGEGIEANRHQHNLAGATRRLEQP